jgi:hypothetical protein
LRDFNFERKFGEDNAIFFGSPKGLLDTVVKFPMNMFGIITTDTPPIVGQLNGDFTYFFSITHSILAATLTLSLSSIKLTAHILH